MAVPNDKVDICNLAADMLKEAPIADIDTPTTAVEGVFSRWYDITRQAVYEAHNFNFSTKSEAISRGGAPSVSIYADYYILPNDYLRLTAINSPRTALSRYEYDIQAGRLLISNSGASSLNVWFIYDETDVTKFTPLFAKLLAATLALVVGYKITAKPSILRAVKDKMIELENAALAANGQERPPIRYENSKIVNAGLFPSTLQQVAGDHEFLFTP